MTLKLKSLAIAIAFLPLAACVEDTDSSAGRPAVGNEYDLSAFVGAKAGQGEMGITNLGYELIRTQGLTAYWFNRSTGACAEITTANGRYESINMLPAQDC